MPRSPTLLVVALTILSNGIFGQQTGDANRDYTVNFNGFFSSSYVTSSLCAGQEAMTNQYTTTAPGSPFVWALASQGVVGWATTPGNSVDIGPGGLTFLLNGLDLSSPINFFATLDTFGNANFILNPSAALANLSFYFAMAHATAMAPAGFYVSQTHQVTFTAPPSAGTPTVGPSLGTTPNPLATVQPLTDDSFVSFNLIAPGFTWYGTNYMQIFVGSNGYVTFGFGDNSLGGSAAQLSQGPPRIASNWDDLNPATGGSVRAWADPAGGFEITFVNVPEYFNTGSNSMQLRATPGVMLTMSFDAAMTLTDGFTGVSPGNNAVVTPVDLSTPPIAGNVILPGQGIYESFSGGPCTLPFDLKGYNLTWLLDASGNPLLQN